MKIIYKFKIHKMVKMYEYLVKKSKLIGFFQKRIKIKGVMSSIVYYLLFVIIKRPF
jgi:hypothetical protein